MQITSTAEDFHLALLLGQLKEQLEQKNDGGVLLHINIVLVSAALCEAIIMRFISYQNLSQAQFDKLDKKPLFNKWTDIPKQFCEEYTLPEEKVRDLKLLINWRKNWVHPKPKMVKDGVVVLKGNQPEEALTKELVYKFVNLPILLATELMTTPSSKGFFKGDFFDYKKSIEGS